MKVNSDAEKLNMKVSSIERNKVLYASQAAFVNGHKDYFSKGNSSVPFQKIGASTPLLYLSHNPKLLLKTYLNPFSINKMAESNPRVKELLAENGIEYNVNVKNISGILNTHLTTTTAYALQIADSMKLSQYEKQVLEQACIFHDFGKVLIPSEILNKPGFLTLEEKEIMNLHSDLGYELLSQTGLNKRVLELVKNHHNPPADDVLAQILSVADMYSALREVRCYKKPLTNKDAIEILDQKAQNGEVSTEVVEALKASVPAELCAV
ncbi:MAG: HD-GYP domain-containing protein [Candidatus Avigastranaerophilus sp.]